MLVYVLRVVLNCFNENGPRPKSNQRDSRISGALKGWGVEALISASPPMISGFEAVPCLVLKMRSKMRNPGLKKLLYNKQ
jgi:hypothetical protein